MSNLKVRDRVREVWKQINNPIFYEVSNLGKIRNRYGHVLNQRIRKDNKYTYVELYISSYKKRKFNVHRIIAKSFIPNPLNKKVINHIDGDKNNNNIKNLEWVTIKENANHAKSNGLYLRNEKHPNAKLTKEIVNEIRDKKGKESGASLARKYGVSRVNIYRIFNNSIWNREQFAKEIIKLVKEE